MNCAAHLLKEKLFLRWERFFSGKMNKQRVPDIGVQLKHGDSLREIVKGFLLYGE